jgi:general secretion pathway protein D
LRLYPQVSSVLRYEKFPVGGTSDQTYPVPVISVRSIESYLRMQDRQVVMLGGLYSNRDTLQEERVPVLSDIPFLGELFTGKKFGGRQAEIVDDLPAKTTRIYQLEK